MNGNAFDKYEKMPWKLRFVNGLIRFLVQTVLYPWMLPSASGPRKPAADGRAILFANHHNMMDPVLITSFYKTRRLSFVAKKELYRSPVTRIILDAFSSIRLDREATDLHAVKTIMSALRVGRIVGLFMQGTRVPKENVTAAVPHGGLLYYAIRYNVPVILVGIRPEYRFWGRPHFAFSEMLQMTLKNKDDKLSLEEQTMLAHEVMRQIYALAGMEYRIPNGSACRAFFESRIDVRPLERGGKGQ